MTVRELIQELLHADMDAEVEIAFMSGEFGHSDFEQSVHAIRKDQNPLMNTIYLCSRDRKTDFEEL